MEKEKGTELMVTAVVVPAAVSAVTAQPVAVSQLMPTTVDELLAGEGVMVRQLTSECCRFLCCQPNIHWTIHPYWGQAVNFDDLPPANMWIQEEAPYFFRCCSCWAPGCRPTVLNTHATPCTSPHSGVWYPGFGGCTAPNNVYP
jgi:hypothetical protein